MAFGVFKDPLQGATFMICILTVPLTTAATALRFHGTRSAGRRVDWEDWFALFALISFWIHAATALWTVIALDGRGRFNDTSLPAWQVIQMAKVGYVMQLNFPFNPTFAKLSLLALYYRVFSVDRTFKRWVWFLASLQICWFLAIFLCRIMFCLPIPKVWDATIDGTCVNVSYLLAAGESVNAAIAFSMIALAIWMVRTLTMSNKSKWKLRLLFVLGGLTGVIDIIAISEAYGKITLNLTYLFLVTLQFFANSICCCAPVYKTIIPDIPLIKKITSKVSVLYGTRSHKSSDYSKDYPMETLVTIGGGVVKRRIGPGQQWVTLPESSNSMPNVSSSWADVANTAGVEAVPQRGHAPWMQTSGPHGGQNVHVQRTFEVV